MAKIAVAFLILATLFSFLDAIMAGGGGLVSTSLDGGITSTATTIDVDEASYFLSSGIITIGAEKISYSGIAGDSLTGCVRGIEQTAATTHIDNTRVYSEDAGIINYALGFNVSSETASSGVLSVVTLPWNFFTITMPKVILWDYGFLSGDMMYLRIVLQVITIGFLIYLAFQMLQVASGIFGRASQTP
jgi:hypothetical protein